MWRCSADVHENEDGASVRGRTLVQDDISAAADRETSKRQPRYALRVAFSPPLFRFVSFVFSFSSSPIVTSFPSRWRLARDFLSLSLSLPLRERTSVVVFSLVTTVTRSASSPVAVPASGPVLKRVHLSFFLSFFLSATVGRTKLGAREVSPN